MLGCAESAHSVHPIIGPSDHRIIRSSDHPHRPCRAGERRAPGHSRHGAPGSRPPVLTSRKAYPARSDPLPKKPDPPAASLTCNRQTPSDRPPQWNVPAGGRSTQRAAHQIIHLPGGIRLAIRDDKNLAHRRRVFGGQDSRADYVRHMHHGASIAHLGHRRESMPTDRLEPAPVPINIFRPDPVGLPQCWVSCSSRTLRSTVSRGDAKLAEHNPFTTEGGDTGDNPPEDWISASPRLCASIGLGIEGLDPDQTPSL